MGQDWKSGKITAGKEGQGRYVGQKMLDLAAL